MKQSLAVLLLVTMAVPAAAQQFAPAESVTVIPGAQYKAGGLHRMFFGTRYRSLWTTPIRVPVLDLRRFAGGLKPTQRGGGQQTKSLRFTGGDGKEYAFRSLAKDPTGILPTELQETFAANLLRDQMSSAHPAGPLVAAPLLDAAGVLHAKPLLVQMPDDATLGEFRVDFANLLGMVEERPKEMGDEGTTFAGATDIVGTDDLAKKLDDDPGISVDARAFLLARLTDVFLGDWDRHRDQWRWALVGTGRSARWLPIPRDRDQAFVRFDGFILAQARRASPQLLNFGPGYGAISGATWNGRDLDRRFLTGLSRPVWDSVAAVLKGRLTNQAIASAVRQLPREFYAQEGARLEQALVNRRDHLDTMAGKYYRLLAAEVDVYGSDKADDATVVRRADGTTGVTLAHKGEEYFRRNFTSGETKEIRLHLQGGGDQVTVEGEGRGSPLLRAIGGGGDDHFTISSRAGGVRLYDDRGENRAEGAGINTRGWSWKPDSTDPRALPPRDWGRKSLLLTTAFYGADVQAVISYGGHTDWYGFRRVPFATRLDYRLQYSTGKNSGRATGGITRQFENSRGFFRFDALASGIETIRWYGFGNESQQLVASNDAAFYRVSQMELSTGMSLGFRFGKRNQFSAGPVLRWSDTDLKEKRNRERFIAVDRPYGSGEFGMVGLRAGLLVDGRDHPGFATKGAYLQVSASGYPGWWDAVKPVGRLEAEGSVALAPNGAWQPSLTLFAGGAKTWGRVPFFVAPTLGGLRTLRGYRPDRFAGDAAVYGSAELRIPLTRIKFIVPGQQGVFGFTDAGRVYLDGEHSDEWHTTVGGGVWFSFLGRDNVLMVGAGKPTSDKEGARVIVGFGFPH
jgi:hypothetical protein